MLVDSEVELQLDTASSVECIATCGETFSGTTSCQGVLVECCLCFSMDCVSFGV